VTAHTFVAHTRLCCGLFSTDSVLLVDCAEEDPYSIILTIQFIPTVSTQNAVCAHMKHISDVRVIFTPGM